MLPADVLRDCRVRANAVIGNEKPVFWVAAFVIDRTDFELM